MKIFYEYLVETSDWNICQKIESDEFKEKFEAKKSI